MTHSPYEWLDPAQWQMEPSAEGEAIAEYLRTTMQRLIREHSRPNLVFTDRRLIQERMQPSYEAATRALEHLTCTVVFRRIQPGSPEEHGLPREEAYPHA